MDKDETETIEYRKARLEEVLDLADRQELPGVAELLASAIERIPEGTGK